MRSQKRPKREAAITAARLSFRGRPPLMVLAASPLEAPDHCCFPPSRELRRRPQCVPLTTSTIASGRALPWSYACRYVAGGAAWFGGVVGRLRANTPVYGPCQLPTLLAAVTCSAREKRASTLHRIGPPCSSHSRVRMSVVCVRRETVGSVVTIARGGDSGLEPAAGSHACSFTRTAASGAVRCAPSVCRKRGVAVCGRVCFSLKTMQRQTTKQQRKWSHLLLVFYWGEVTPLLLLLGR